MTIYYVDGAVGSDDSPNDGLSEGAGNAWATIDHAMNNVVAGDIVYVKASATYDENANIDTAGGITTPILFEGYTTTTGDNGLVNWTNSGGIALTESQAAPYYVFKNFDINSCSNDGVAFLSSSGYVFWNCKFRSNSSQGFVGTGCNYMTFLNCEFTNNTAQGFDGTGNDNLFLGCIFSGNGSAGADFSGGNYNLFYKCVAFDNSASVSGLHDLGDYSKVIACTIDMENASQPCIGAAANETLTCVVDNILYDGSYGSVHTDTGLVASMSAAVGYNLINSMATGNYNGSVPACISTGVTTDTDVTSAPAFSNEAADDYTLSDDSPAIGAGIRPGGIT